VVLELEHEIFAALGSLLDAILVILFSMALFAISTSLSRLAQPFEEQDDSSISKGKEGRTCLIMAYLMN